MNREIVVKGPAHEIIQLKIPTRIREKATFYDFADESMAFKLDKVMEKCKFSGELNGTSNSSPQLWSKIILHRTDPRCIPIHILNSILAIDIINFDGIDSPSPLLLTDATALHTMYIIDSDMENIAPEANLRLFNLQFNGNINPSEIKPIWEKFYHYNSLSLRRVIIWDWNQSNLRNLKNAVFEIVPRPRLCLFTDNGHKIEIIRYDELVSIIFTFDMLAVPIEREYRGDLVQNVLNAFNENTQFVLRVVMQKKTLSEKMTSVLLKIDEGTAARVQELYLIQTDENWDELLQDYSEEIHKKFINLNRLYFAVDVNWRFILSEMLIAYESRFRKLQQFWQNDKFEIGFLLFNSNYLLKKIGKLQCDEFVNDVNYCRYSIKGRKSSASQSK